MRNFTTKLIIIGAIILCSTIAATTAKPITPQTANAQCVLPAGTGSCNAANGLNHADQQIGSDQPRACGALSAASQTTTGLPRPCG